MKHDDKLTQSAPLTSADLSAVNADSMDRLIFKEMLPSKMGKLIDTDLKTGELVPSSEACVQDVFNSLYKISPKVKDEAPMLQKGLADQLHALTEYKHLHASSQLDEISAALGTLQLGPQMLEQLQDLEEKLEDRKPPAPGKGSGPNGEAQLSDMLSDEELVELRNGLRQGIEQAQAQVDSWEAARKGWGVDPAELKTMDPKDRMEMAERLMKTKQLNDISDLAGRFKNVVNAAQAIVFSHGNDEIVDIGPGRNLEHMLPSEMIKLKMTPKLFYRDMMEGKTLVYNMRGQENLGRGPLIMLTDHSGSMSGTRDAWAKAVTLSMIHLAEKQKRAFGYLAFNEQVKLRKFYARGMSVPIQDKLMIASLAPAGGTSFYRPIMAAFEMRLKDPELKPSDILLITDGECELDKAQLREIQRLKVETQVRIFGIAINDSNTHEGTTGTGLEGFCDEIAVVNSLGEIKTIRQIVTKVASNHASDQKRKAAV
jgi:uncharacterized protein with von Willebrand factor type A (vWA) domain